jgi:phosphatidylserine/phosphatidylglycerophosphate/cardiolipin synthase-like enzyme
MLIADDGATGGRALLGSCNWLQSPFQAHELSIELRDDEMVANCLELLQATTSAVPSARGSRDAMQAMEFALRRAKPRLVVPTAHENTVAAQLTLLAAPDHLPLLRRAAHEEARFRFVCMTHKLGAPMVSNLLDPAQAAGERIEDVRAYYSLPTGPVKKRHVRDAAERLAGTVKLEPSARGSPMLHAKVLLWDDDDVVVTSFNWGSQSASEDSPLDEIGLHLRGSGLAQTLHVRLLDRIGQYKRP